MYCSFCNSYSCKCDDDKFSPLTPNYLWPDKPKSHKKIFGETFDDPGRKILHEKKPIEREPVFPPKPDLHYMRPLHRPLGIDSMRWQMMPTPPGFIKF